MDEKLKDKMGHNFSTSFQGLQRTDSLNFSLLDQASSSDMNYALLHSIQVTVCLSELGDLKMKD